MRLIFLKALFSLCRLCLIDVDRLGTMKFYKKKKVNENRIGVGKIRIASIICALIFI